MKLDYVIQRSFRRTLCIHISKDGQIVVKAPFGTSKGAIDDFLREKRGWILGKLEKAERNEELAQRLGAISEEEKKEIRKAAKKIIPERVAYFAGLSGITYGGIRFGFQKSCWGSCSARGNLNFNCLLILMPPEVLDSVVVHELCHRRHMNHSKAFYAEVLKYFPEYHKWDKWLKENGQAYFMRLEK